MSQLQKSVSNTSPIMEESVPKNGNTAAKEPEVQSAALINSSSTDKNVMQGNMQNQCTDIQITKESKTLDSAHNTTDGREQSIQKISAENNNYAEQKNSGSKHNSPRSFVYDSPKKDITAELKILKAKDQKEIIVNDKSSVHARPVTPPTEKNSTETELNSTKDKPSIDAKPMTSTGEKGVTEIKSNSATDKPCLAPTPDETKINVSKQTTNVGRKVSTDKNSNSKTLSQEKNSKENILKVVEQDTKTVSSKPAIQKLLTVKLGSKKISEKNEGKVTDKKGEITNGKDTPKGITQNTNTNNNMLTQNSAKTGNKIDVNGMKENGKMNDSKKLTDSKVINNDTKKGNRDMKGVKPETKVNSEGKQMDSNKTDSSIQSKQNDMNKLDNKNVLGTVKKKWGTAIIPKDEDRQQNGVPGSRPISVNKNLKDSTLQIPKEAYGEDKNNGSRLSVDSHSPRRDSVSGLSIDSRLVDFSKTQDATVINPPDLEGDKKKSVMTNNDSFIKSAIPYLPLPVAIVCLIFNMLIPGTGTMISGFAILCSGRPRIQSKDDQIMMSCCINVMVGVCQLFTVTFLLVGWFWSLSWGVYLIILSIDYKKLLKEERELRLKTMVLSAFGAPPIRTTKISYF